MAVEADSSTTTSESFGSPFRRNMICFSLLWAVVAYQSFLDMRLLHLTRDLGFTVSEKIMTYREKSIDEVDYSQAVVAFDWNEVNLKQKANCGMVKCFFDSTRNDEMSNSTSNVGYLIASQKHYAKMRRASQLAQWMTHELGAQHFYMEQAHMVQVTPEFMSHLNGLVDQPLRQLSNKTTKALYNETEDFVVVQKVVKAPSPTLTFGSSSTKRESLPLVLPAFRQHIPNQTALVQQLRKEREIVYKALVAAG